MKVISLSLLCIVASSGTAFALRPADPTVLKGLNDEIKQVQALEGAAEGKDPLKWTGVMGLNRKIREETKTIDPDYKKIAVWNQQLASIKSQESALCQKLIDETRDAYDIKSRQLSAPIVLSGGFNATRATWRPEFGEMEQNRTRTNRDGDKITMSYPGPYAAITWENGEIVVTIDAFAFSAGYLASVIEHETIHFDQFTTPGRGNQLTPVEREWEAYKSMQGRVSDGIFHLTPQEKKVIDEAYHNAIDSASSSPSGAVAGASGFELVAPNPEQTRTDGDDSFFKGLAQINPLARKVHDKIQADEAQVRAAELRKAKLDWIESDRRFAEWKNIGEKAKKLLWAFARAACSNPSKAEAYAQQNKIGSLDELLPGLNGASGEKIMNAREVASYDRIQDVDALSECQASVLDSFDEARRRSQHVSGSDFARWARSYHDAHPGFLARLGSSISDSFTKLGKALTGLVSDLDSLGSGDEDGSESAPSERRSGSRTPRDNDRPNNLNNDDVQARNDAYNRRSQEISQRTHETLERYYAQDKANFERRKREIEAAQNIRRGGTGATENK